MRLRQSRSLACQHPRQQSPPWSALLVAPPRTGSTAIALSLSQAPNAALYLHEPFSSGYKRAPSAAAGFGLIAQVVSRGTCQRADARPTAPQLIIKEMATHLSAASMRRLCLHCRAVALLLRWPSVQLRSLIRTWRWDSLGRPKRLRTNMGRLSEDDWDRFVRDGNLREYFQLPWRALHRHYDALMSGIPRRDGTATAWCIVDSDIIFSMPRQTIAELAARLGLEYSCRMVSGWSRDKACFLSRDAWSERAGRSHRVHKTAYRAPALADFPSAWRKPILEAVATYLQLLRNPHTIRPWSLDEVVHLSTSRPARATRFVDLRPATCYALAATTGGKVRATREFLRYLRFEHPGEATAFDAIDLLAVPCTSGARSS